jgi:hypothetical protein
MVVRSDEQGARRILVVARAAIFAEENRVSAVKRERGSSMTRDRGSGCGFCAKRPRPWRDPGDFATPPTTSSTLPLSRRESS